MKINNFWGDISDISAKHSSLVMIAHRLSAHCRTSSFPKHNSATIEIKNDMYPNNPELHEVSSANRRRDRVP